MIASSRDQWRERIVPRQPRSVGHVDITGMSLLGQAKNLWVSTSSGTWCQASLRWKTREYSDPGLLAIVDGSGLFAVVLHRIGLLGGWRVWWGILLQVAGAVV